MTEELLARRYRALLVFYPRWYREERGAELVGTLLDAARPGQTRPRWRELRSLVLEGLRARAGTRSVGATLSDTLRVTVLLTLAMWMLGTVVDVRDAFGVPGAAWWPVGAIVVAFGVAPFVLVARGRFGSALPLVACGTLAGAGLPTLLLVMGGNPGSITDHRLAMLSVVAFVGAAVLRRYPPRPARAGAGTLVAAVALPLLAFAPAFLLTVLVAPHHVFWLVQVVPLTLLYLGALGYVAVDPRPALVGAAFLIVVIAQTAALVVAVGASPLEVGDYLAVLAGAAVVAVVAAGLGLRRQAAVLPTKVEG